METQILIQSTKKIVGQSSKVLFLIFFLISFSSYAVINYDVTRSTSSAYTSISLTGTSVSSWRNGTNTDDNLSNSLPIGFNFSYDGGTYSSFLVSINGFITFNTGTPSDGSGSALNYSYVNGALSSGTAPLSSLMIAPFYEDMICEGNNGILPTGIYYQTTGIAGSRVLTVQWTEMEMFTTNGPNLNFQVKLYEGSNLIDFAYGPMNGFNGTFNLVYSFSAGLNSSTISTTPTAGQVLNQLTGDTRNFGVTPSAQLNITPECNSTIRFTPGSYSAFVPGSGVPVNNDTAAAILLSVNPSLCLDLCGTIYSSVGATASSGIPDCAGADTPDDDVWFKFIAINPNTTIKVAGSGNYDPTLHLLTNTKANIQCSNTSGTGLSETLNMTTLTVGATYYIRVYHKGAGSGSNPSSGQFSICVSATPLPPSNDNCVNSINLPISATLVAGTSTVAGTGSAGIPACLPNGVNPDDDVWYKFTALKAIEVITVEGNTGFNAVIQLFSGSCSTLTSLACTNLNGTGQTEVLTASGLTINSVYYFRVFHAGIGGGTGSYSLSVSSPPPPCVSSSIPPDSSLDIENIGVELIWDKLEGADNYIILLDSVNPPVQQLIVTTDTFVNTGLLVSGTSYFWKIIPGNGNSYNNSCSVNRFYTVYTPYALNIRVFLEGFYTDSMYMKSENGPTDTIASLISVSLIDTVNGTSFTQYAKLNRNGWAKPFYQVAALGADYFIVINHRNHLETWSKQTFPFYTPDTTYDFSISDSRAFGNNQVAVDAGVYALYVGDVNQDGAIDSTDLDIVSTSSVSFTSGSIINEDINVDNVVESADFSKIENQIRLLKVVLFPTGITFW